MTHGFLVLHELRLATGDLATRVLASARLAGMPTVQGEQRLPLLVSIDDQRDVACVRRVRQLPTGDEKGRHIHEALALEPEGRAPPRYYNARAAIADEHGLQAYYRMAVTESGTNEPASGSAAAPESLPSAVGATPSAGVTADTGLLWIGTPVASETGLVVITGHHDAGAYAGDDPQVWPLRTSRELGVRIYESPR